MTPGVTVIIPTLPSRMLMLSEAVRSVSLQLHQPEALVVVYDLAREGAMATRTRGVMMAQTEFIAFLDDDDVLDRHHLQRLLEHQAETDADLVYPWHRVVGGNSNFLKTMLDGELVCPFGVPFGPEQEAWLRVRNFIPVTTLVRTELAQEVGGFQCEPFWWDAEGNRVEDGDPKAKHRAFCEEWQMQIRMLDAGAKFSHLPETTWSWMHHSTNTSGLPEKVR